MVELEGRRMLVVAPHPDDEVIGCGGTISRAKEQGAEVFVLFVTVGETSDLSGAGPSTAQDRMQEVHAVADYLDFDGYAVAFEGSRYHLQLDDMPQHTLIGEIEDRSPMSIQALEPDIVLLPRIDSYNQDHRAVSHAVMSALRPTGGHHNHQPPCVWVYEEAADQWNPGSSTTPNVYVSLDESHLDRKFHALKLYDTQYRESPNPRSVPVLAGLAALRGSQSGTPLAEAFQCLRFRF